MKKQVMTKGQAGFSLVELMVVVAIIGVLAMMAVPKVNAFIAKSRQSEAKVNLSSFYTFNKNFYVEFQGYTTNFSAMGFQPEGQLRYNVGVNTTSSIPNQYTVLKGDPPETLTQSKDKCPLAETQAAATDQCFTLVGADGAEPADVEGEFDTTAFSTFTAQATASLIADAENADVWSINQSKNLLNTNDGTVPKSE